MTIVFKVMRKGVEYEAMIDDEDADLLALRWHAKQTPRSRTVYVEHGVKSTRMHRVIMERMIGHTLARNETVDHKDLNGLNNQRENLRIATYSQNGANKPKQKNNTTRFKGVFRERRHYRAQIQVDGKKIHLGMFETPEEANAAYQKAAKKYFGEFARGE